MCLNKYTIKELLDEINNRSSSSDKGILDSESNNKIYKKLTENENLSIGICLTFGLPETENDDKYKCRACGEKKHSSKFSFYLARVDKEGFLMRSNALCNSCSDLQNKKRTKILNDANKSGLIPKKPKSGDTCQGCEREWHGNWHRHHNDETHEFVSWLCGHCNMSLSEQRGVFKQ
jgi:hypothetical protein